MARGSHGNSPSTRAWRAVEPGSAGPPNAASGGGGRLSKPACGARGEGVGPVRTMRGLAPPRALRRALRRGAGRPRAGVNRTRDAEGRARTGKPGPWSLRARGSSTRMRGVIATHFLVDRGAALCAGVASLRGPRGGRGETLAIQVDQDVFDAGALPPLTPLLLRGLFHCAMPRATAVSPGSEVRRRRVAASLERSLPRPASL